MTGEGSRHHEFREDDEFTELLQDHYWIDEVREEISTRLRIGDYSPGEADYWLGGLEGVPKYFQDYSNLLTLGNTGNLAVTFLGSYELEYFVVDVDREVSTAAVLFHVSNESTLASAIHPPVFGYTEFWLDEIEPFVNDLVPSGPMSEVTQNFWWTESIQFK